MKRFLAAVLTSLLGLIPLARADVPRTIPFQAVVASPSGVRVDGVRSVTFTLYDAGGVNRWTETKDLPITQGLLTTMLGDTTAFPDLFPFDRAYTLGISVGGDPEMTPRPPLGVVPYAHYALASPWSGLSGIPPGFSDGVDNDTTYTAGAGLSLTGTTFAINTAGSQAGQTMVWNGANIVWGNPLASGLVLPYAVSAAVASPASVFSVTNAGTGHAGSFEISRANSISSALAVKTIGTGLAGYFQIDNAASGSAAVYGYTNGAGNSVYGGNTGTGSAVAGTTTGAGDAGHFEILNSASASEAVYATTNGSGRALYASNTGTGRAGFFEIDNTSGSSSALAAKTNGTGQAGNFQIDNIGNPSSALYGYTNGTGNGIYGGNAGTGRAGRFQILNTDSAANALEASTNGLGDAVTGVNTFSGYAATVGVQGECYSTVGRGVIGIAHHATGVAAGVFGDCVSPNGYGVWSRGDVYVDGDLTATGSKAGYVADTVLNDDTEPLAPGDVVEIAGVADPVQGDIPVMRVRKARTQGSSAVLGPVDCALSVAPMEEEPELKGRKPGRGHMHAHRRDGDIPVGGYGRVVTLGAFRTVKVDASSGPIRPGDLLVSSGRPGYAIPALRPEIGTVIGKALGALESGMGEIAIFVSPR